MNRHCLTTAALLAAFPVAVMGETYEVSNASSVALETGDVVSAVTTDIPDALPDVGSTPLFHLDASRTNGWVFASGTNAVTKIPSLVGSRYLYVRPNSEFWSWRKRSSFRAFFADFSGFKAFSGFGVFSALGAFGGLGFRSVPGVSSGTLSVSSAFSRP